MSHPLPDMMNITMGKIREMVDANTVVGDPISTPDGVTIIPVSTVKMGFASGGSDFTTKNASSENPFGGGAGAGVTVTPVAFLVVKDGNVRMLPVVDESASASIDRLLEIAGELTERIGAAIANKKKKKDAEAEQEELPEEEEIPEA